MQLKDILDAMGLGMDKCKSLVQTHCLVTDISASIKQYDPKHHTVADPTVRRDKQIKNEAGEVTDTVYVARLPIPIQKKIVLTAASFLGNPEINATPDGATEEMMLAAIEKTWEDNKLDYRFRSIAKKTMSQRQAAELWFLRPADADYWKDIEGMKGGFKLSMKVLSHCNGDSLYPVFDDYGDMIAFGRGYKVKNEQGKEIEHFDVYTADNFYFSKNDGGWLYANIAGEYSSEFKAIPNILKKIPVVYYYQPLTEWEDVQPLIDRLETITSNHADTNDYSGSPIVVASGNVQGFAAKGEQGKMLQADNGAKVEYLTYDSAPESIRMEIDNLKEYIYTFTHTPDISFDKMKGLGVFSGIAIKMLFLDAHLKAADKEELFGECMQRRLNFLKTALSNINRALKPAMSLKLKPKFYYFLPEDFAEELDNIVKALKAGIMSKETAIKMNPLISDTEAEIEAIEAEGTSTDQGAV